MSGLRFPKEWSLPAVPRLPSKPSGAGVPFKRVAALSDKQGRQSDIYGFDKEVFGKLPDLNREYLSEAYDFFNAPKTITPTQLGMGTIPEMVFFGGLLVRGFKFNLPAVRGFTFQSDLLGGRRLPGGTVADFTLFVGTRVIAVYVDSFFHTPQNPFGGAAKIEQEVRLRLRLLSRAGVDAVVRVSRVEEGSCLENGPEFLVRQDFRRAISA